MTPTEAEADTARLLIEAEIAAERLVSVLRMWVAGGLLAFFVLTVGPFADDADAVHNRQWLFAIAIMSIYFAIGFLFWRIGVRGLLRPWMIWVTVTLDCALLLFNIWLSLQNTNLDGQSVFLLPPAWLIPIALAFAMLRVNPAVQIYTAVWVIAGLALLMVSVPPVPPALAGDDSLVTFFLAGPPNVMRLVMIGFASLTLTVAARRMRALLMRSIVQTRARANLTRYLPAQIADELAEGEMTALRQGQREAMAIMFVDIRGFTGMSNTMTPAQVSQFVTEFRRRVTRIVQAHGGMIDKFMGDAVMILFRPGQSLEEAAGQALAAADDLVSDMSDWSARRQSDGEAAVAIGVGAHWGEVFVGVVGDDTRLEFSVFGDAVNVAARLEAMSKTLGAPVIVSHRLLNQASQLETGKWRALGRVDIAGRDEGIEAFAMLQSDT